MLGVAVPAALRSALVAHGQRFNPDAANAPMLNRDGTVAAVSESRHHGRGSVLVQLTAH